MVLAVLRVSGVVLAVGLYVVDAVGTRAISYGRMGNAFEERPVDVYGPVSGGGFEDSAGITLSATGARSGVPMTEEHGKQTPEPIKTKNDVCHVNAKRMPAMLTHNDAASQIRLKAAESSVLRAKENLEDLAKIGVCGLGVDQLPSHVWARLEWKGKGKDLDALKEQPPGEVERDSVVERRVRREVRKALRSDQKSRLGRRRVHNLLVGEATSRHCDRRKEES